MHTDALQIIAHTALNISTPISQLNTKAHSLIMDDN